MLHTACLWKNTSSCLCFRVYAAIFVGAISLGRESAFVPDYGKSKLAAGRIFAFLARIPDIDSYSTSGLSPVCILMF